MLSNYQFKMSDDYNFCIGNVEDLGSKFHNKDFITKGCNFV